MDVLSVLKIPAEKFVCFIRLIVYLRYIINYGLQ